MTEIASTDVPIVRLVAPDGTAVGDVEVGLSEDERRELLWLMIRSRRLDRECWALQRQGELTVYPPFEGQEAAQVGSAFALGADDFVFPSFRELAAAVVRGVDVVEYLQYHRGTWHGGPYDPIATRFAPICVPVATQIIHAVGWAMGAKLDGSTACSLAYFGDGSASEGDFHEGANLAAVFRAPAILFCQNNGWAISVPSNEQFAALIEAVTYRIGSHSTADDAARYRDEEEVTAWRERDPIDRYRTHLLDAGTIDDAFVRSCDDEAEAWVANVRAELTALGEPPAGEMFDHAFANPPPTLLRQREELIGDG